MKTISGSGPLPNRPFLLCSLALLFLTACATTRTAEENEPSDAETVAIGYGTVNRDHLVGSVATYHAEDTYGAPSRTLAEMLRRIPGVRVIEMSEGGMTVRIRGATSFLGGEEPLFVIDGMVIQSTDSGLISIDPNNIESITVLKNADATAIFGSRGANGVLLIKTKRG